MPRWAAVRRNQAGFTLIEVIVVLAIIAVLGTIAFTYFPPLNARVRAAFDRDELERQVLELPRRVRLSGHGGILTSRSGDDLPDGTVLPVDGAAKTEAAMEEWQVLRLRLPGAWRLRMDKPIFYHFSGACEGGELAFVLPPVSLHYTLTPPLCRPIRDDGNAPG